MYIHRLDGTVDTMQNATKDTWINCPQCGLLRPKDDQISQCACGIRARDNEEEDDATS